MMKLKYILPILLTFIGFTACKKYEEDKGLRLKTVKQRFYNRWKIVKYEVNGQDLTEWFKTQDCYCEKLHFTNQGGDLWSELEDCINTTYNNRKSYEYSRGPNRKSTGVYFFNNINYNIDSCYFDNSRWDFKRLSKGEMILQQQENENTIRVYYEEVD